MKPMVASKFSRPTTAKKTIRQDKPIIMKTQQDQNGNDQQNLIELMEQLILSQKECQKSGKYVQAQAFKRKVKALQQQVEKHELISIKQRHEKQRKQIQKAHLEQLNCFHIQWNQRMVELQKNVHANQEELIAKHEQQIKLLEQEMNAQKPFKFKQSAVLLNMKKIQQQLAKQQNYLQAHQIQIRSSKLQKQEIQKWKKQQSTKCKTNLNLLKIKQQNQLSALKQRIDLAFDEKLRQKEIDQQAIVLKYQNVLKELDYQQKQQITKYEKAVKLKGMQKKTKANLLLSNSKASMS